MTSAVEQRIRERAYALWVAAGMSDGGESENWLAAERAVLHEMQDASMATHAVARTGKPASPAKKASPKTSAAKGGNKVSAGKASSGKAAKDKQPAAKASAPRGRSRTVELAAGA